MSAVFSYAAVYQVKLTCVTPLRTAGADGATESVLQAADNTLLLQGASIAGALRQWAKQCKQISDDITDALFGSREQAGHLVISDGIFDSTAEVSMRPRLRINRKTGTAADGGKFDLAHINAGATINWTVVWMGEEATKKEELVAVGQLLGALDAGLISLGAQKTNGFGRVRLDKVAQREFKLANEKHRTAWLNNNWAGYDFSVPTITQTDTVEFILQGTADSILVKASAPIHEETGSYMPNLTENGTAILPSSSVKGAVRCRMTAIAELLGMKQGLVDEWFGYAGNTDDSGKPGQICFSDVQMDKKSKRISRIRIDRFTGGVVSGGLFEEEPVCSSIKLQITLPAALEAACGLLVYALRDLGLGLYNFGSGSSIGRGFIQPECLEMNTPDGVARLRFGADGSCTVEEGAKVVERWLTVVEDMKNEN